MSRLWHAESNGVANGDAQRLTLADGEWNVYCVQLLHQQRHEKRQQYRHANQL